MNSEKRIWGRYQVLYEDSYCKIKKLYIDVGKNISYQTHQKRDENWTIISGKGKYIIDGKVFYLNTGDKVEIKRNKKHTIKNIGDSILIIHEIQSGESFEESDIKRLNLPEIL